MRGTNGLVAAMPEMRDREVAAPRFEPWRSTNQSIPAAEVPAGTTRSAMMLTGTDVGMFSSPLVAQ